MHKNLQEATHYVYAFLNHYYQEEEFLPKYEILMELFNITMEKLAQEGFSQELQKELETSGTNEIKSDSILSTHLAQYPQFIQESTVDYLENFIDWSKTKIVEEK